MNLKQTLLITLFYNLPKDLCLSKINPPQLELEILGS